jgi:hypothetical protein
LVIVYFTNFAQKTHQNQKPCGRISFGIKCSPAGRIKIKTTVNYQNLWGRVILKEKKKKIFISENVYILKAIRSKKNFFLNAIYCKL